MSDWSRLPPGEIKRRRQQSIKSMDDIEHQKFSEWYQKTCDARYWQIGQCCAGCDFWISDKGLFGRCSAAGIMSGIDVLLSIGAVGSSYIPPPGFPFTEADDWCGKFKDQFDWSSLGSDYLKSIGAFYKVMQGERPSPPAGRHSTVKFRP